MRVIFLVKIAVFLFTAPLLAQNADTLEQARQLAWTGSFQAADSLLSQYSAGRDDSNALRLHGQVLYWMQAYDRCFETHERAMELFPELQTVRLDYARIRFELGHYRTAAQLLDQYLEYDSMHPEANILRARIDFYNGRPNAALVRTREMLLQDPENPDAPGLIQTIRQMRAPYLDLTSQYRTDDQPLQSGSLHLKAGRYGSRFWHPLLNAQFHRFFTDERTTGSLWLQAGNRMQLPRAGLSLDVNAGIFVPEYGNGKSQWTGAATLRQRLLRPLYLEVAAAQAPYQYTLGSVQTPVVFQTLGLALDLNHRNQWLGRAAWDEQLFGDTNRVRTLYAWGLFPIVSFEKIGLLTGYSFSHAHAERNLYEARETLDAILDGFDPEAPVEGYYPLYFTPTQQVNHGFLVALYISPSKRFRLDFRANLPIHARIDNPYLFLDVDAQERLFINQGFAETRYEPLEVVGQAGWQIGPRIRLGAQYRFARLFFYELHQGNLSVNVNFYREK